MKEKYSDDTRGSSQSDTRDRHLSCHMKGKITKAGVANRDFSFI